MQVVCPHRTRERIFKYKQNEVRKPSLREVVDWGKGEGEGREGEREGKERERGEVRERNKCERCAPIFFVVEIFAQGKGRKKNALLHKSKVFVCLKC
jgi:hypothetical protein